MPSGFASFWKSTKTGKRILHYDAERFGEADGKDMRVYLPEHFLGRDEVPELIKYLQELYATSEAT